MPGRRTPWGVWIALIAGVPALIIAVVVIAANQPDPSQSDPSFDHSYQFGHDKLGPVAKIMVDSGRHAGSACEINVEDAFLAETVPAWWNPSMGRKGCMAYLSENEN